MGTTSVLIGRFLKTPAFDQPMDMEPWSECWLHSLLSLHQKERDLWFILCAPFRPNHDRR